MEALFTFLYPAVTIISVAAYLPQIKSLIYAKSTPENMSLSSWMMWVVSTSITLGYGVFALKDLMFCASTAIGLTLCITVTSLIVYNRYIRFGQYNSVSDMVFSNILALFAVAGLIQPQRQPVRVKRRR